MTAPFSILWATINTHKASLQQVLGSAATTFFSRLAVLYARSRTGPDDAQEQLAADLLALIDQYPPARQLLRTVAPDLFGAPDVAGAGGLFPEAAAHPESLPFSFGLFGGGGNPSGTGQARGLPDMIPPPPAGSTAAAKDLDPLIFADAQIGPAAVNPAAAESAAGAAGAAPVPMPVRRYASIQAPGMVEPAHPFTLSVGLVRQPPTPDAVGISMLTTVQVVDGVAQPTGAPPVSVLIYASAFQVVGPTRAQLQVYPDRDSDPAQFQLQSRPGLTGVQQISVTFLQGGINILGRVVVKVQIGGPGPLVPYSLPVAVSTAPATAAVAEPDVVLWVDRVVQNNRDYLHFRYMWPQNGQRDPVDADPPRELNKVEDYAQALYQQLSDAARYQQPADVATNPAARAAVAAQEFALRRIGANLYEQLFPPALKQFYKQIAPVARTILIYSTEPWIPWELVVPNDADLDPQYSDFLCARFEVARWLIMEQDTPTAQPRGVPATIAIRQVCRIIPPSNLPATTTESNYLGQMPQRWPPLALYSPDPRTADDVLAVMRAGQINLFHFATHGQVPTGNPGASAILLPGRSLTPDDVFEPAVQRGLRQSAPLVFINACHSGHQGLALTGLGGWVDKLLKYGCSGFIGGNWEVQDDLAAQFAITFYEGLRAGQTFGAACLAARRQIRAASPGNSTWLAYVLYAHPQGTVQIAPAAAPPAL